MSRRDGTRGRPEGRPAWSKPPEAPPAEPMTRASRQTTAYLKRLFEQVGFTPAQALRRATIDMAEYLGEDQQLGSIERGKLADFFLLPGDPTESLSELKNARMVVKDGVVYFPSELYPRFGIKPFVTAVRMDYESWSFLSRKHFGL